jgi:CAI-1 autoinducer synthase
MSGTGQTLAFTGRRLSRAQALDALYRRIAEWKADYAAANLIVVGGRPGPGAILLANNDYLALARDPRIVAAIAEALRNSEADVLMSTVYVQYLDAQRDYEAAMARYLGTEAAVLCQSGWAANDGLIQVLAESDAPVYVDLFAHASLWQGIHSAGAKPRPFRHNDPESLSALIARYGPGVVAVDSVYSTSGDVCPLRDLVDVAEHHGCVMVVDESHAAGLRGPQGAGLVAELELVDRVHFRTFSLSKAFAGRGGIVAGPARAMEYFRFQARPSVFSSAVLEHEVAGFATALDIVRRGDERRQALRRNSDYLRAGLLDAGCRIANNDSPIIALVAGSEERTVQLRDALEARNVFGAVFCAPSTPKNRALVRLTLNAALAKEELDQVIAACSAVHRETGLI